MTTLFLVCALLGGALLALQLVLGLFGLGHYDLPGLGDVHLDQADAFNLLSMRALSAGLTFFGVGGLGVTAAGGGWLLALPVAAIAAGGAMLGVAALMRGLLRLQDDGSVHIEGALGAPATVYLGIPGERAGAGKVQLALQGRIVEYQAVSETELPTGAAVVVVDVLGPDTVEVAPTPTLGGPIDA